MPGAYLVALPGSAVRECALRRARSARPRGAMVAFALAEQGSPRVQCARPFSRSQRQHVYSR